MTLEKGTVHFWSRSRGELWHKGETSGNFLHLVSARLDCDADALVFIVRPDGPACHTNRMSCFFNEIPTPGREGEDGEALDFDQNLLESVYRLILERKEAGDTDSSYVARLFARGGERVLEKIDEEAAEVVMAMKGRRRGRDNERGGRLVVPHPGGHGGARRAARPGLCGTRAPVRTRRQARVREIVFFR